ncbi:MAG: GyrI-like domain-containing protein [Dehalococcoidia bacterium]|nr:GyrI-like domain-containing protein [Dehalococcoidia bacterium]
MAEVTIVDVPAQTVVGIKRTGRYSDIPALLGELVQYAMANGGELVAAPVVLIHEMCKEEVEKANREGSAILDVNFPIAMPITGSDRVSVYELKGGTMAKIVHKGPYEECETAYNALFAWIAQNGRKVTGNVREVYPNDPRSVPPEDILTEIYAPIV